MPTKQFEGKIRAGHVLIAEEMESDERRAMSEDDPRRSSLSAFNSVPVGYCIGNDQYFKRDDVGIIYQMNVLPGKQRGLIGASLLKAMFERSAYGCKLYCCWCAQDIAANKFWEAMGFVPLAFRAGSEKKSRTHIFWQKRIRSGDVTTPWWFPSKTAGGSIREDRIVLPIPPGTHWSDAKPLIFPEEVGRLQVAVGREEQKMLNHGDTEGTEKKTRKKGAKSSVLPTAHCPPPTSSESPVVRKNGLMFDIPQPGEVVADGGVTEAEKTKAAKAKSPKEKTPRIKRTCDPRLVSAARELRDRWLEQVNASPLVGQDKYDVNRALGDGMSGETMMMDAAPVKLLAA